MFRRRVIKADQFSRGAMMNLLAFVALALMAGASCTGTVKNMRRVPSVVTAVGENQSGVIFVRPSRGAIGVQSSIFEVGENASPKLVGILAAKTKLFYATTPGTHMFMVLSVGEDANLKFRYATSPGPYTPMEIGRNADFMSADLAPGVVYHAVDVVRTGVLQPRHSLRPLTEEERQHLQVWLAGSEWVVPNEESALWARDNAAAIEDRKNEYLPQWKARPASQRPALGPDDVP
jgi:hypothetical protein